MKRLPAIFLVNILAIIPMVFVNGQKYVFREMLKAGEMENARVQTICQDHDGFIRIGTSRGLYRYDGSGLERAVMPESRELSITSLYEDTNNRLWAGTGNGGLYCSEGSGFVKLNLPGTETEHRISSITEDNRGNIWVGVYGKGIYVIRPDTVELLSSANGLTDDYIYSMVRDRSGRIWVGTDNGINICSDDPAGFHVTTITVADGLPDFIVTSLALHPDGRIVAGFHDKGFCILENDGPRIIIPEAAKEWNSGPVASVLAFNYKVWISAEEGGLFAFDLNTGRLESILSHQDALPRDVHKMLKDSEGNIWLLNQSGVYHSFGEKLVFFMDITGSPLRNVHTLLAGRKGKIWFSDDTGLYYFSPSIPGSITRIPLQMDMNKQKIMSLYEDDFGFVWAGTFGNGVFRVNIRTFEQQVFSENDGLVNGNVLAIEGDSSGIWFGTLGGISRYIYGPESGDPRINPVFQNYATEEGLTNHYIYHIHTDHDGRTWFATDGSCVFYFEDDKFFNIAKGTPYEKEVIYSVVRDTSGTIWMNGTHDGLLKYNDNGIRKVFNDYEHRSRSFSGIAVNSKNELVIAYDDGIDVLDIASGNVVHYEDNAGLEEANPDLNTVGIDQQGNTWIGLSNGIVKYALPEESFQQQPVPVIDKVAVFLQEIDKEGSSAFPYHQNHFTFFYSGLWYQQHEKVRYLIKLEGHDLSWMETKNRNAVYSGLSPGKYTFRVKASLYENFSSADEDSYSFIIRKPFRATVWFYFIIALLLTIVVLTVVKLREKRLKRKQEALREQMRFRFESLKSQINPHFLFNSFSTLVALIEDDGETAIEYVEELSTLFRNVLEFQEMELIALGQELEILHNYFKLQAKRYGNNLTVESGCPEKAMEMKIPPLTLQILAENAIKHNVVSAGNPLMIKIYCNQACDMIFLENNLQPKKDEVQSYGIGITNITKRYQLLTGRGIEVRKTEISFRVGLPLLK